MTENTAPTKRSFALRLNIWLLRLTRNWLRVVLVIIAIYVALPVVAPVLMQVGATAPARVIYTMYSPFCHQFAFRSFFLFGEQGAYPRAIANTDLESFEAYVRDSDEFRELYQNFNQRLNLPYDLELFSPPLQFAARAFVGNNEMGYKMTLCERDMMIYFMLLVGGVIYSLPFVRRRLRPVPVGIYILLGLGPIGIDGFSQLLGYPPFNFWDPRETTPFFRVLTGGIFGFMNAWLGFPYIAMSMEETREQLEEKLERAGIEV